jgi:hypothetical protein
LTFKNRYGLWEVISQDTNTSSLLGSISNPIIQTLVIEPPMFSGSAIADLAYPTINFTLPIQIDIIIRFNDQLKIQSYDATLSCLYLLNSHNWLTSLRRFRRLPGLIVFYMDRVTDDHLTRGFCIFVAKTRSATRKGAEFNL